MVALQVKKTFKVTGRGYVLVGVLQDPSTTIKIGDYLKTDEAERRIEIKGIEILNYGSEYKRHSDQSVGVLADLTEEEAKELIEKTLYKHI